MTYNVTPAPIGIRTPRRDTTHPAIAEVAILGIPDRVWGDVGVAVLREGARVDEGALLAWMAGRVVREKMPKRVFFWDALPRSGYGKITKMIIRDELAARGCLVTLEPAAT